MSDMAAIVGTGEVNDEKRFTVYKLVVQVGPQKIAICRRYNEFRNLYDEVKGEYAKGELEFPKKKYLGNNFDKKFIQQRQEGLQKFISQVFSKPRIINHAAMKHFLSEAPRHGHRRQFSQDTSIVVDDEVADDGPDRMDLGGTEDRVASINDFTIHKVIGRGSFGKVLLATRKSTGDTVAIKVLNKDAIIKQNEVNHIRSERNVLIDNCKHPFLVGLQTSFQTKNKLFFVLDFVCGGELFFHLQREKKFPVSRVQFYAAEIASALGYLHGLNIVYRDLKPENILFTAEGHVVLTDFGLCKENVLPGETTKTFCGTPEYLAPEVLNRRAYGRAVDWWCLGCVTYEMLCGLPPFYSRDCSEMYDRILHDKLKFPEHVPIPARRTIEGFLNRDPNMRLGSADSDVEEVMASPFFATIDWDKLEKKELQPPWKPQVMNPLDTGNFDPEFVNEPVPQSVMNGGAATPNVAVSVVSVKPSGASLDDFEGFTYDAKGSPRFL